MINSISNTPIGSLVVIRAIVNDKLMTSLCLYLGDYKWGGQIMQEIYYNGNFEGWPKDHYYMELINKSNV